MSDKKATRPYFRKYFLRSLTSLFHVWSLNRNLTSNPSSSLTLKMTCPPRPPPPYEVLWLREKNKSRVISHCGVQQTNTLEAMIYVAGGAKKPRLYLSLALTVVKGKCPVFPEGPLSAPGCCVQVSETRWPFSVSLNPCAKPLPLRSPWAFVF